MKAEELRAEELRIGNLVKDIDGNIFNIKQENLCDFANGFIVVKPIPLTEDWLVDFGFSIVELDNGNFSYQNNIFSLGSNYAGFYIRNLDIKYVHQLQNLHFSLSGKELIIK